MLDSEKLIEAKKLWSDFEDIPIDEDDDIDVPFLHFEKGANRFQIWHWFEETYNCSIVDDLNGE